MQANNTVTFQQTGEVITITEVDKLLEELFAYDSSLKALYKGLFDLYETLIDHDDNATEDAKYTLHFIRHFITQMDANTTRSKAPQP